MFLFLCPQHLSTEPKLHFRSYTTNQMVLFPQRIDENIAENDPVRIVSSIVDHLDMSSVNKLYNGMGRCPYHPRNMAYRRFRQIGVDKVKMDFAFFAIAFNIKKMVAKMTKGGLFSYLRIYLNHITPYKLFTRLFFVEKKTRCTSTQERTTSFLLFILGVLTRPLIIFIRKFYFSFYPTFTPGFTSPCGPMTTRRPSASSALRIMPWLSMPLSLRGGKLAMKHTSLPIKSAGS